MSTNAYTHSTLLRNIGPTRARAYICTQAHTNINKYKLNHKPAFPTTSSPSHTFISPSN